MDLRPLGQQEAPLRANPLEIFKTASDMEEGWLPKEEDE
jgi:hypothetical protein